MNLNYFNKLLLTVFILYLWPAFSEEKSASATEAGASCIDQNCAPTTDTSLQILQETNSDALCELMQNDPECKGIDKEELKGCLSPANVLTRTKKTSWQCGAGMKSGVEDSLILIRQLVSQLSNQIKIELGKEADIIPILEEPGLFKAYLHAEFESASQDSGTVMAALETTGSVVSLLWDSMGEVYSCLNGIGRTKKVCQFIASMPVTAVGGAVAGLMSVPAALTTPFSLVMNAILFENQYPLLIGAVVTSMGTYGILFGGAVPAVAATAKYTSIGGAILGATVGAAITHDETIRKRIQEKMKNRVLEFKKQQENQ